MSGDRFVTILDDKDNMINLGLHHVQQLRIELDLARLQIEDLQKVSIIQKLPSEIHLRLDTLLLQQIGELRPEEFSQETSSSFNH